MEMPLQPEKTLKEAQAVFVGKITKHDVHKERCHTSHTVEFKLVRFIKGFYSEKKPYTFDYTFFHPTKANWPWEKDCPMADYFIDPLAQDMSQDQEVLVSAKRDSQNKWVITGTYDLENIKTKEESLFPEFFQSMTEEDKLNYKTLSAASAFSSRAVGAGGVTPETVKALWKLMRLPNAKQVFKSLKGNASLPGQIYGYCGLVLLGETASEEKKDLSSIEEVINTQEGCTGGGETVSAVMSRLNCNHYKEDL